MRKHKYSLGNTPTNTKLLPKPTTAAMVLGDNVKKHVDKFEAGEAPSKSSGSGGVEMVNFNRDSINSNNLNLNNPSSTVEASPTAPAPLSSLSHTPSSRSHNIHNNFDSAALMRPGYRRSNSTNKSNNRASPDDYDEDWSRLKYFTRMGKPRCNKNWVTAGIALVCIIELIALIILATFLVSGKNSGSGNGRLSTSQILGGRAESGSLIFDETFDTLNLETWRHDRYMTEDGFVIYSSNENNSYVEDGILFIEPTFTEQAFNATFLHNGRITIGKTMEKSCSSFFRNECDRSAVSSTHNSRILNPIMSATMKTSQSFVFQYGIIEMRAKMPKGDWISTEISLKPRYQFYGEPTDTAKIVMINTRGNEIWEASNRSSFGNDRICSQLIYSDSQSVVINSMTQYCLNAEAGEGFADDFHTYKFEWNPDIFKIYVDNRLKGRFIANTYAPSDTNKHVVITGNDEEEANGSSFNQKFYIELKVGVGTGFPDRGYRSTYQKPWVNDRAEAPSSFWSARSQWGQTWQNRSAALQIDYIKVHAL